MFASARRAASLIFDPAFFGIVLKSVALTLGLFLIGLAGLEYLLYLTPSLGADWLDVLLDLLAPVLIIILTVFLGPPVAAVFGSLFLDEVAEKIEARHYPQDIKAPGTPFWTSFRSGLRLAGLVVGVNIALLPLDLLFPGGAEVFTLLGNGWLLGREFFELAALRHLPRAKAEAMRQRHGLGILMAGTLIALLSLIPFADLFAPLFGTAFMVHLYKFYAHQDVVQ